MTALYLWEWLYMLHFCIVPVCLVQYVICSPFIFILIYGLQYLLFCACVLCGYRQRLMRDSCLHKLWQELSCRELGKTVFRRNRSRNSPAGGFETQFSAQSVSRIPTQSPLRDKVFQGNCGRNNHAGNSERQFFTESAAGIVTQGAMRDNFP